MNEVMINSSQKGESRLPTGVRAALARCGWQGTDPPADLPHDVVVAISEWVATQGGVQRKGAYLRRILETPGEAIAMAARLGLVTVSGSVDAYADKVAAMSPEDYWSLVYGNPDLAVVIETEAARRASMAESKVTLALLRQVAYEHTQAG
jgi:hypothetical protein